MTTNRMGLEQALSDERLEQVANIGSIEQMAFPPSHAQCEAMARELLAYRKASKEPVAYIGVNMLNDMRDENRQSGRVWINDTGSGECIPLYASPPLQAVTVPGEKLFSDEFWRMVDENNKGIDIGQLGYDNCNALCKAAYQAACNTTLKSVTNEP